MALNVGSRLGYDDVTALIGEGNTTVAEQCDDGQP
jgi:hypothetical protein